MAASPPVKKRTKSAKSGPRKKRRSEESKEDDAGDSDSEEMESDDDEGQLQNTEEDAEVEEGEAVIGRGGRRGAKVCTIATRARLAANRMADTGEKGGGDEGEKDEEGGKSERR